MHINMHNICMPTIMTINSVRFYVYFNDHGVPHCHVIKDQCEAKIEINSGVCVAVNGFSKKDVKKLSEIVKTNSSILMDAWREYNEEK